MALAAAAEPASSAPPPPVAETPAVEAPHREVLQFAYSLMDHGDYYRAITELERYSFLEPGAPETWSANLAIGRAYELGGKASDAATWLQRMQGLTTTPQLRADLLVELAYARYLAGSSQVASDDLERFLGDAQSSGEASHDTRERARYLLGWTYLTSSRLPEAAETFRAIDLPYSKSLALDVLGGTELPHKSPVLAGALSAVVPGLGHVYLGQPFIGLAAFGWNALFGFATYDALHRKIWGVGSVLAGLELLWYGGAIFGAVSGAQKYNRDAELNFLDTMKSHYDPAPTSWPPGGGASATFDVH